ncbi:MAG: glutathione S-transferase family protein [Pseudomonadota bacterium]
MQHTLYGASLSPFARAARVAFEEKKVPYEFKEIGFSDLQQPDYARLHPYRKLPALEVGRQPVFETVAIMRYADEANDRTPSLQPGDGLERAHSVQWSSVASAYLYADIFTGFVFQRTIAPRFGMTVDETSVEAHVEKTRHHLDVIRQALAMGTLGKRLSLGDILVVAILDSLNSFPEGQQVLEAFDAVDAYTASIANRDSFIATQAEDRTS